MEILKASYTKKNQTFEDLFYLCIHKNWTTCFRTFLSSQIYGYKVYLFFNQKIIGKVNTT